MYKHMLIKLEIIFFYNLVTFLTITFLEINIYILIYIYGIRDFILIEQMPDNI